MKEAEEIVAYYMYEGEVPDGVIMSSFKEDFGTWGECYLVKITYLNSRIYLKFFIDRDFSKMAILNNSEISYIDLLPILSTIKDCNDCKKILIDKLFKNEKIGIDDIECRFQEESTIFIGMSEFLLWVKPNLSKIKNVYHREFYHIDKYKKEICIFNGYEKEIISL